MSCPHRVLGPPSFNGGRDACVLWDESRLSSAFLGKDVVQSVPCRCFPHRGTCRGAGLCPFRYFPRVSIGTSLSAFRPTESAGQECHLLSHVPLAAHIRKILDDRSSHFAPRSRFSDQLEDSMSEADAERTLRAITSWSRYAELFAYDDKTGRFTLDNPA